MSAAPRYSLIARLFHWGVAALVLAMIPAGVIMVQEGLPRETANMLYIFHKNVGVLVLLVVLARLAYRFFNPVPPLPAGINPLQKRISHVSHALLYVLLIAMPILGAGVVIGLVVSIIQSVTSIQDQTLTFVPKIIVMMAVVIVLTPWIFARLIDFAAELLWVGMAGGGG